jgi:hypothetical protein
MATSEPRDPPGTFRGESVIASGNVDGVVNARRLLTINPSSPSLKAALYGLRGEGTETPALRAEASRIETAACVSRKIVARPSTNTRMVYRITSPRLTTRWLGCGTGARAGRPGAVGHRSVHGGDRDRRRPDGCAAHEKAHRAGRSRACTGSTLPSPAWSKKTRRRRCSRPRSRPR